MTRSQIFLLLLQLLTAGCGGYAQTVLSVVAPNISASYQSAVELACTVNYTGTPEPPITIKKVEGPELMETTDGSGTAVVPIPSVDYLDMGAYICSSGTMNATFWLTINEYVGLHVPGVGFGSVSTADQLTVTCPIMGNPGPEIVYWQNEDGENITTTVNPDGPFVNENGELDLRNAPPDEGSMYTCTAVDVTGDRLTQQFVVEVVEEGRSIFTRWYLILVYCVVGVLLLIALVVAIWFAVGSRDACYMKVPKTVKVREHVKRSDAFGFQLNRRPNLAYKMQEEALEDIPE